MSDPLVRTLLNIYHIIFLFFFESIYRLNVVNYVRIKTQSKMPDKVVNAPHITFFITCKRLFSSTKWNELLPTQGWYMHKTYQKEITSRTVLYRRKCVTSTVDIEISYYIFGHWFMLKPFKKSVNLLISSWFQKTFWFFKDFSGY